MVKITSSWVGEGHGKMGDGIYYVRMGQTCAKKYVPHINDANSIEQQSQRSIFNVSLDFSRNIKAIYNTFWTSAKPPLTRYNAFLSYTMINSLKLDSSVWQLDWQKIRFSSGTLVGLRNPSVTNPSAQTNSFKWDNNSGIGGAKPGDIFTFILVNLSTYKDNPSPSIICGITSQIRSAKTFNYSLPETWCGNELAIYACFISPKGDKSSNSQYFTTLTLK